MEGSMENSKPTDEQQTELEKQSTDTTIGSCSELLPLLKGKTLLIKDIKNGSTLTSMKEILKLLLEVWDEPASKQIRESIESGKVSERWYNIARPPYPGECKTDIRMVFSEPPALPPNINSADLVKGWTDVQ